MKPFFLILALALSAPTFAFAGGFKLDSGHTTIGFKIKHLVIATVNGRFNQFEGTGQYDEKTGKLDQLRVTIDSSSIDTNEPKRDEHLKGKDFFDTEKFPKITFSQKKVEMNGKKPVQVLGDLVIHGITKPVTLEVDFKGITSDPWGTKRGVFEASGAINRKDFGLTWNKSLDSGGVMIGDEVKLVIEGEVIFSEQ